MASGSVQNGTAVTRTWRGVVQNGETHAWRNILTCMYVAWCYTKQCILHDAFTHAGKGTARDIGFFPGTCRIYLDDCATASLCRLPKLHQRRGDV